MGDQDDDGPGGGREVTVEEVMASTRSAVHQLAPLVVADPPVRVQVWDAWTKDWYPGWVKAWRGPRVSVEYTRGPGSTHLVWLPADTVRRVDSLTCWSHGCRGCAR